MSKHTPGPWKAERYDGDWVVSANHMCTFPGMRYHIVHRIGGDRTKKPTKGTPKANARLIAAAPELLEALIGCFEHMEHSTPQGAAAYAAARAAIAKATGDKT